MATDGDVDPYSDPRWIPGHPECILSKRQQRRLLKQCERIRDEERKFAERRSDSSKANKAFRAFLDCDAIEQDKFLKLIMPFIDEGRFGAAISAILGQIDAMADVLSPSFFENNGVDSFEDQLFWTHHIYRGLFHELPKDEHDSDIVRELHDLHAKLFAAVNATYKTHAHSLEKMRRKCKKNSSKREPVHRLVIEMLGNGFEPKKIIAELKRRGLKTEKRNGIARDYDHRSLSKLIQRLRRNGRLPTEISPD